MEMRLKMKAGDTIKERIFLVIEILKKNGVIKKYSDFYLPLGMGKVRFSVIKNTNKDFTTEQIESICKSFNINANYIFGIEKNPFLEKKENNVRVRKMERV